MKKDKSLWVVVPAFNEEKHIEGVIKRIKKHAFNIVVVDDGSYDKTSKIATLQKVDVIRLNKNSGKGKAARIGCDYANKKGAEKIILIDSDGQHDPEEIPKFLSALKHKDIVFGYRTFNNSMPTRFRIGNNFINWITKLLYGIKIKDTQCGYRAFKSKIYPKIRWKSNDYSMESQMIAKAGKYKLSYAEVPIKTIYHDKYKGTTVLDGIKIVLKMIMSKLF